MPAIVGIIQVINVSSSGVMHIGDVFKISPYSTAKTFAGAGSFNTGDQITNNNRYSTTHTNDSDALDQPVAFNV